MPDLAELQVVVREKGVRETDVSLDKLQKTSVRVEASVKRLEKAISNELNASLRQSKQAVTDYDSKLGSLKSKVLGITKAILDSARAFEQYNRRLAEAQKWFNQSMSLKGPGIGIGSAFAGLAPQFERGVQSAMTFGRELAQLQTRFSGLSTGAKTFAAQQYDLTAALNRSVDPTKRLVTSSNNLGGAYGHLKAQTKELPASLRQNAKEMADLTQQSHRAGVSAGSLRRSFYDLRNIMIVLGVAKIAHEFGQLGQFIVRTGMEMERLKVAMTGLMGSQTGGAVAMDWMRKFAIETPYNIEQSMRAFMLLKAYGLDPMNGALQTAADLAARFGGDAEKFHYIALAMGQMHAHQRILSREMLQFAERGVPAWTWLAEALNRINPGIDLTTAQLRKMVATSKLGQEAVTALFDIMAEKSRGASEILMQTLWGKLQKIGDMMRFMAMDLTEGGLFGAAKKIIDDLATALTTLTESGTTWQWGHELGNAFSMVSINAAGMTAMLTEMGDIVVDLIVGFVQLGAVLSPAVLDSLQAVIDNFQTMMTVASPLIWVIEKLAEGYDKLSVAMAKVSGARLPGLAEGLSLPAGLGLVSAMGRDVYAGGMEIFRTTGSPGTEGVDDELLRLQRFRWNIDHLGLSVEELTKTYGNLTGVWEYAGRNLEVLKAKQDWLAVAYEATSMQMKGQVVDYKALSEVMFQAAMAAKEISDELKRQIEEAMGVKSKLGPVAEQFQDVLIPALREAGQSVSEFLRHMKDAPEGLVGLLMPEGAASIDVVYQMGVRIDELTTKLGELIRTKAPDSAFAALRAEVEALISQGENLERLNVELGKPSTREWIEKMEDLLKKLNAEEKKAADYAGEHGKAVRQLAVVFEDLNPAIEDMVEFIEALESKTQDSVLTWREFQQAVKAAVDTGEGLEAMREQVAQLAEAFRYLAQFQTPEFAAMFNSLASFFEGMLPGLDRAMAEMAQDLSAKFATEMNRGIADVFGNSFKALLEGRFESLSDFLSDLFANLAGTVVDRFVKEMVEGLMGGGGKGSNGEVGGIGAAFSNYTDWVKENRGMAALTGASMVYSGYQQAQGGNRTAGVLSGAIGGAMTGASLFVANPLIGAVIGAVVGAAIAYFGSSDQESPETQIRVRPGGATNVETRGGQGYSNEMQYQASLEIQQSYRSIFRAYLEAVRAFRMGDLTDLLSGELPAWESGTRLSGGWGEGGVQSFQSWLTEVEFPRMFQSYFGDALRAGLERLGMSFAATSRLFRELSEMTGADRMAALVEFVTTLRTAIDTLADFDRPIDEVVGANSMEQYSYQLGQMGEALSALFIGWDQMNLLEQGQMLGEINTLVMQAREAELQMLQQIHDLQEQITEAFRGAREQLELGSMQPGEQIFYFLDQIREAQAILSDPTSAPEDIQRAAAEIIRYVQLLSQVLQGLGLSLSDVWGDIGSILAGTREFESVYNLTEDINDLHDALAELGEPIELNLTAMEEYENQLEDFAEQIEELMATFDPDDLEASAQSAQEIADLVLQARQAEIAMLEQIDSIQRSVTAALQNAIEAYRIEQMDPIEGKPPQEQVNYWYDQIQEDFRRIAAARSPEEVEAATRDLISDIGSLDQVLRDLGFDANSVLGDIFRRDGRFDPNQTMGDWFIEMLARGQESADIMFERFRQDVIDRFQPFYDSLETATAALEDLQAATIAVRDAIRANETTADAWWELIPTDFGTSIGDWLIGMLDDAEAAAGVALDAMAAAVIAQFQPFWDALLIATYWVEHFGDALRTGPYRDQEPTDDTPEDDDGGGGRGGEGTYGRTFGDKSLLALGQQQADNIARLVTALQGTVIQPMVHVTVVGGGVRSVSARTTATYLTRAPIA